MNMMQKTQQKQSKMLFVTDVTLLKSSAEIMAIWCHFSVTLTSVVSAARPNRHCEEKRLLLYQKNLSA